MKDTILILLAVGALAWLGCREHTRPAAVAGARAEAIAETAAHVDNLREEIDHLSEQLSKAQIDNRALATERDEARAALAAAQSAPPSPQPQPSAVPAPSAVPPAAPVPDPAKVQAEAQLTRLTANLATWQTRRAQVAASQPPFQEQTVDPKTGRRSGIRTSDADRARWQSLKDAELAKIDAAIATLQRDIATAQATLAQP